MLGVRIASRFELFSVPKWRESPEFREFVVSFGRLLPLERPSPLADKAIVQTHWFEQRVDWQGHRTSEDIRVYIRVTH
jgi:hypothetical protein